MSELPSFGLNGKNGEMYEGTPDNSHLYLYLGELGLYSNATVQLTEDPPVFTRVFYHHPGFNQVRDYMLENGYPVSANLRRVGEGVLKSFENDIATQTEDTDMFPSEWLDGDTEDKDA